MKTAASPDVLTEALRLRAAGLSVIPINWKLKKPFSGWTEREQEIISEDELRRGMALREAFAVIGGKVSGDLYILDFDVPRFYGAWRARVGKLADDLPVQQTGGGGYQAFFRCPDLGGNAKFAWMEEPKEDSGRTIAIESRGEGGYAVVPPSKHPTGNRYKMLSGDLANIPTIPRAQADALIAAAKALDEAPKTRQQLEHEAKQEYIKKSRASRNGSTNVIDAFNKKHTIEDMLVVAGYAKGPKGRYIRPGGESESVSVKDGRSCHWSTNDPLNDDAAKVGMGVHDAFDIWALTKHDGDISKAVAAAAEELGLNVSPFGKDAASARVAKPSARTAPNIIVKADIVDLSSVTPQPITWLWKSRIAVGKLTIVSGDPGLGKSFLSLDIASRVSTGAPWPDMPLDENPVGGTIILSAEDDLSDTVVPRLIAAGADLSRIKALTGTTLINQETGEAKAESFTLDSDLAQLEEAITATEGCRLVIVDPLTAYCGKVDSHKNAEVRAVLAPLSALAAKHGVAVLAISHLTKAQGQAIHRTLGSLGFVAAAPERLGSGAGQDRP